MTVAAIGQALAVQANLINARSSSIGCKNRNQDASPTEGTRGTLGAKTGIKMRVRLRGQGARAKI
jgi:hypothetical protein